MFKRYLIGLLTVAILLGLFTFSAAARSNTRILDTGITPIDDTTSLSLTASAVTTVETTVKPAATEAASAAYSTLTFGSSGPEVVDLQCRLQDLGYYNYKVTGYYGELTCYAVKLFQKYNKIADTGTVGELTNAKLYLNDAVRMPMDAIDENANRLGLTPTVKPTATKKPSSGGSTSTSSGKGKTGAYYDWWKKVQYMFPKGMTVTVTDYYTGVSWKMKRTGGKNHADCETLTAADTAKYKSVYGSWSWARRPVVVNINGTLVAASINGMPHGYDTISSNNMSGQICIHFLNSRTHCTNAKDPQHQKCVKIAAGLA